MSSALSKKYSLYDHWEFLNFESGDKLRIVPERGGLITSWVCSGQEIFYLDQSRFKDSSKSVRGGMPILFPICGNLPGNQFFIDDTEYFLNQHGFARDASWNLQPLEDGMGVRLSLKEDSNTLISYPFAFNVNIDLRLKKNGLYISAKVTNNSKKYMPFSFGFHPYFKINDLSNIYFKGLPKQCINQNNMLQEDTSFQTDYLSDGVDFLVESIEPVLIFDQSEGFSIELKTQEPFAYKVIWTDPPRRMICLEPWTSPRNSLISGTDILTLPPGANQEVNCQFLFNRFLNHC